MQKLNGTAQRLTEYFAAIDQVLCSNQPNTAQQSTNYCATMNRVLCNNCTSIAQQINDGKSIVKRSKQYCTVIG